MKFRKNKSQIISIILSLIMIVLFYLFFKLSNIFYFLSTLALLIAAIPFFISLVLESNIEREKDEMFLEFARGLVENVRAGTPISKSIFNIKNKDYGVLNPYINKLANQIALGIPLRVAFETFSRDVGSKTISLAIGTIIESEKAGGQIGNILESVTNSILQTEKLKKERRATMYTLIVEGYIIFLLFIIIMLIIEFKILPIASELGKGIGGIENTGLGGLGIFNISSISTPEDLTKPLLWLLIVQGFFAGLVIGKLSEGKILYGLKHSFILVALALLINTGAKVFLG